MIEERDAVALTKIEAYIKAHGYRLQAIKSKRRDGYAEDRLMVTIKFDRAMPGLRKEQQKILDQYKLGNANLPDSGTSE